MVIRPLDENGDMMPVSNLNQMLTAADAISQVIHLRMDLLKGEWWENESLGFRAPEFLVNGIRRGEIDLLAKYIASYISGTSEVLAVKNVNASYANHEMHFSCVVITGDGEKTIMEVDLDGLL